MSANHYGVCESCARPEPLYMLHRPPIAAAAVCISCLQNPDIERITKAQAVEDARAERNAVRRWPRAGMGAL